jgi:hypothetical protein
VVGDNLIMLDKRTDGGSASSLHTDSGMEDFGSSPDTSLGDTTTDMEY